MSTDPDDRSVTDVAATILGITSGLFLAALAWHFLCGWN